MAAYNEEERLPRRLDELASLIKASGVDGEIIVVSDGSTDKTAVVALGHGYGLVRVVKLNERIGKGAALTKAARHAKGDILVFADARQTWHEDALTRLLENFADPSVGAVGGDDGYGLATREPALQQATCQRIDARPALAIAQPQLFVPLG